MTDLPEAVVRELASQYEFQRELGRGGMAVVYLARDIRHERQVAIKVMRDDLTTAVGSERFLREIAIAARLTHPNILALYNSGVAAGMLYYVMPYIPGETLRDRLDRERQLPIREALAIGRQVAAAVDYAHAQGVVHRDIKPENVLLQGDHALVADFGLARALYTASPATLTQSGMAVGTPAYMSPEQATGDRLIDGRTDVYSLACVIFEMIAGVPPFRAATLQALLAQHATREPPSLSAERMSCPPSIDEGLRRGLAKLPADRFRSAAELMQALEGSSPLSAIDAPPAPARRSTRWIRPVAGAIAVAVVVGAVATRGKLWAKPLDETRYAVLPFSVGEAEGTNLAQAGTVQDGVAAALNEWRGLNVVDKRRLREAIQERARTSELRLATALKIARDVRARNLIWGDVSSSSDSLRITATLYDAETGAERRSHVVTTSVNKVVPRQTFRVLTNRLLRDGAELPWSNESDNQPASIAAWVSYDSGRAVLQSWDLSAALRHFRLAISRDQSQGLAQLWLARTLMWADSSPELWKGPARRAAELSASMTARDSLTALALLDLAESRFPQACERYRLLVASDTMDFGARFGLAECHFRDPVVIPHRASPSGFAFRAGAHSTANQYLKAIELAQPSAPAFVYARLGRLLRIESYRFRIGRLDGSVNTGFAAYESLVADTLAHVPFPLAKFTSGAAEVSPPTVMAAIERNRESLRKIYLAWVQQSPQSVDAHMALARVLEATEELAAPVGQASALGEVRAARILASDSPIKLKLLLLEIRLRVKTSDWAAVAHLTDSVLTSADMSDVEQVDALVGEAALTGRLRTVARMLDTLASLPKYRIHASSGQPLQLIPAIQREYSGMLATASLGACSDSLRGFPRRLWRMLESYYPDSSQRAGVRSAVLRRPLALAAPCLGGDAVLGIDASGDRMVLMQQALARRDYPVLRAQFDTLRRARKDRPGDVAIEYTYLESWMLAVMGDTVAAADHLDRSLQALPTLGSFLLDSPAQGAGLVRAMMLRAELAAGAGDKVTARRWASAVVILWSHADEELQTYVSRMKAIASS